MWQSCLVNIRTPFGFLFEESQRKVLFAKVLSVVTLSFFPFFHSHQHQDGVFTKNLAGERKRPFISGSEFDGNKVWGIRSPSRSLIVLLFQVFFSHSRACPPNHRLFVHHFSTVTGEMKLNYSPFFFRLHPNSEWILVMSSRSVKMDLAMSKWKPRKHGGKAKLEKRPSDQDCRRWAEGLHLMGEREGGERVKIPLYCPFHCDSQFPTLVLFSIRGFIQHSSAQERSVQTCSLAQYKGMGLNGSCPI